MNPHLALFCRLLAMLLAWACARTVRGTTPTDEWLAHYGLQAWEVVLDPDGDGFTTEAEFAFGTDPLDPLSRIGGGRGRSGCVRG